MIGCVVLEILFLTCHRMQSAAGYMVFAEKRMALGAHLRKMPMGYFTEGNIGKISSVLSTDMVFIEENCMTVLADLMSYVFAESIMVVFMLAFNLWLGLLAVAVIGIALLIGGGLRKAALEDSSVRLEQSESLTEAVLDFTEGIGIIMSYNLLGEKSRELSDSFRESRRKNLQFEENHSPWQLRLNLVFGLGAAAVIALSMSLHARALLDVTYLVGIMLLCSTSLPRSRPVQPERPSDGHEQLHGPYRSRIC
jgi:ATP-binding cassette subfamily B protein